MARKIRLDQIVWRDEMTLSTWTATWSMLHHIERRNQKKYEKIRKPTREDKNPPGEWRGYHNEWRPYNDYS